MEQVEQVAFDVEVEGKIFEGLLVKPNELINK